MANGVLYATAGARRSAVAIDAATGETMWMYRLDEGQRQTGVPMTYAIGGQQYIVVATGAPGEAGQLVALTVNQ